MKKILLAVVMTTMVGSAWAQPEPQPQPGFQQRLNEILQNAGGAPAKESEAAKFDLDFPGGTPKALIEAIQNQGGVRVNAIIPEEYANVRLPELHMKNVTVRALFNALKPATRKSVTYLTGTGANQQSLMKTVYSGFLSEENSENPVWYFYSESAPQPTVAPNVCQFWQLEDYLKNYKIEDITTAIQTGWQLMNISEPPTLKFHPETKLLIGVGKQADLKIAEEVLNHLKADNSLGNQPGLRTIPSRTLQLPPPTLNVEEGREIAPLPRALPQKTSRPPAPVQPPKPLVPVPAPAPAPAPIPAPGQSAPQ